MSYYDDDYEEYDDYEEEPDPESESYLNQYNQVVKSFCQNYSKQPVQQPSTKLISDAMKQLHKLPYEPESLRKSFAEDAVKNLKQQDVRNKLMKELFLGQFKRISPDKDPKEFLKVLKNKETLHLAGLTNKYGDYSIVLRFILSVIDRVEPTLKNTVPAQNTYQYRQTDEEDGYEYSDVLYWEAVHDGDIVPDDYKTDSSYDDFDDYGYYDHYDYDEDKKYTSMESVALSLESYISELENESAYQIPNSLKRQFLNRFKKHVYKAESILKDIEVKEHFAKILPELKKTGAAFGLTVKVSESFDTSVYFLTPSGKRYIEFTLFNPIDDKQDWSGNWLSLFIDDIEKNCTERDLTITLAILQVIGYQIGNEYKDSAKKAIKCQGFDTVKLRLPSGLKIEMINHYNELRQSFKWQDS